MPRFLESQTRIQILVLPTYLAVRTQVLKLSELLFLHQLTIIYIIYLKTSSTLPSTKQTLSEC